MDIDATTSTNTVRSWVKWVVLLAAAGVIITWLMGTPVGIQGKADAIGFATCHRIQERSFTAYDRQCPLCARCTGSYMGVLTGLGLTMALGRGRASRLPSWRVGSMLLLFVAIWAIDGFNSYLHLFPDFEGGLYEPNNTLRFITGFFYGMALIHGLYPIFNNMVWKNQDKRRAIANLKELFGFVAVGIVVILLMLSGSDFIRLIFGVVSAFGILVVLTMVFGIMFMALTGTERAYERWGDLWLPLLAGLTVAIIMIGGIDALRYMLTGTWDGFNFSTR